MKILRVLGLSSMLLLTAVHSVLTAQTNFDRLLENYEKNGQIPREVAYLHLNKNVFLEGEQLAFKAYLWDRTNHRPANANKNLYVKLKTKDGATLSEQMVLLENGSSFGLFEIDSIAAKHGTIFIQAFTDYMQNFNETNHFEEEITVLNSAGESLNKVTLSEPILELFSEGGALVFNKPNIVRIRLQGKQVKELSTNEVLIKDETNSILRTVKLDSLGQGQFLLTPKQNKKYFAHYGDENKLNILESIYTSNQTIGVKNLGEKIAITSYTNQKTSEKFFLAIHNGKKVKALDIEFDKNRESIQVIPKTDLFDGMNIFTLCNENGNPLAERYYYQIPEKIKKTSKLDYTVTVDGDSIRLTFKNIGNHEQFNTLSASILPYETKGYNRSHNFISYSELIPFTSGKIATPKRYFQNTNAKSSYDLNNALIGITNKKNWNKAIKDSVEIRYLPENGITLHGTVNRGGENFIVNGTLYGDARSGIVEKGTNTFKIDGIFPISNEKLTLMEVNHKGKFEKPGVFLRYQPMLIPNPNFPKIDTPKPILIQEKQEDSEFTEYALFQKVTILDEVEVTAKKEEKRRDSIRDRSRGRVDFFDIDDTRRNMLLSVYLNQFGFTMIETSDGSVNIFNRSPNNPATGSIPAVYLDNFFLADFDVLFQFRMDIVDYVEINRLGISGLRRGGGGLIKIYTDPSKFAKLKTRKFDFGYQVPLGFELPKKYRLPDYLSFDGKLFKHYGVIGWEPWLSINEENQVTLTVYNPGLSTLNISLEGIINENQRISKEFKVEISENQ